jgi:hypothetical protein
VKVCDGFSDSVQQPLAELFTLFHLEYAKSCRGSF